MSCALAGLIAGGGGAGTGAFFGAIFTGGAGRAETLGAAPSDATGAGGAAGVGVAEATIASRRRRATGASTVLDADFTYSPIS
jgi:hypothetical protein